MKTVLLPVKDFKDAKQRLSPVLGPDQRAGLARAMITGTNAFVFTPPCLITVDHGNGSFSRHLDASIRAGFTPAVLELPGVSFDIDTPEDLRLFSDDPRLESATWRFLRALR